MMQEHNYSLIELDDMMPWEREVYVELLKQHIEKKNEEIKAQEEKMKRT
jgi:hypothetical protein